MMRVGKVGENLENVKIDHPQCKLECCSKQLSLTESFDIAYLVCICLPKAWDIKIKKNDLKIKSFLVKNDHFSG